MSQLKVGKKIPSFSLPSTSGIRFSTDTIDRKTILFFYPLDLSSRCTIEARGFSLAYDNFLELGYEVLGVSPDNFKSINEFRDKESLPFHLLADEGSVVCNKFNLLQRDPPDEMYPIRRTFLVDEQRTILGIWSDIDVSTHSEDVVNFVMDVLEKGEG